MMSKLIPAASGAPPWASKAITPAFAQHPGGGAPPGGASSGPRPRGVGGITGPAPRRAVGRRRGPRCQGQGRLPRTRPAVLGAQAISTSSSPTSPARPCSTLASPVRGHRRQAAEGQGSPLRRRLHRHREGRRRRLGRRGLELVAVLGEKFFELPCCASRRDAAERRGGGERDRPAIRPRAAAGDPAGCGRVAVRGSAIPSPPFPGEGIEGERGRKAFAVECKWDQGGDLPVSCPNTILWPSTVVTTISRMP